MSTAVKQRQSFKPWHFHRTVGMSEDMVAKRPVTSPARVATSWESVLLSPEFDCKRQDILIEAVLGRGDPSLGFASGGTSAL
jgi:hypothetical protein